MSRDGRIKGRVMHNRAVPGRGRSGHFGWREIKREEEDPRHRGAWEVRVRGKQQGIGWIPSEIGGQ